MEEIKKNDVDNIKTLQNDLNKLIGSSVSILDELFNSLCETKKIDEEKKKEVRKSLNNFSKHSETPEGMEPEKFDEWLCNTFYKDYEPDSSPIAWQYYIDTYSNVFVLNEKLYNYCNETKSPYYYNNNRSRICGNFSYEKDKKLELLDDNDRQINQSIGFAGDCCFNFNSNKIEKFHKIIPADTENKLSKLLNITMKMHHSPLNFALMPINGGMNIIKGESIWGLDRFDTFIAALYLYFSNKQNPVSIKLIAIFETSQDTLLSFLKNFNTFDDYCKYFYPELSEDKELCNRLIESGKQPIKQFDENGKLDVKKTTNRLLEYIELAIDFWEAKAKYFEKVTKQQNQANNSTTE